ncbi:MAG: VOC family protein [Parcubacteria group bacterium]|nr:VOC family protein [Parcubacteria group bacterium]
MNNHIAIPVKNLEESKKFYEKLGFRLYNQFEKPKENLKAYCIKNKSNFKIELIYHPENEKIKFPKLPEILHIGIEVKNLGKKLKRLKENNIKVIKPITKGVTVKHFTFIEDPNGFSVELLEI